MHDSIAKPNSTNNAAPGRSKLCYLWAVGWPQLQHDCGRSWLILEDTLMRRDEIQIVAVLGVAFLVSIAMDLHAWL
jgi:hypothetical protein